MNALNLYCSSMVKVVCSLQKINLKKIRRDFQTVSSSFHKIYLNLDRIENEWMWETWCAEKRAGSEPQIESTQRHKTRALNLIILWC